MSKSTCETCLGEKEVAISCCTGEVVADDILRCPCCYEGLGLETCPTCNGTGHSEEEPLDRIPGLLTNSEDGTSDI